MKVGYFLFFALTMLLSTAVYAQSQAEPKNAEPFINLEITDKAPVVVNGRVRFHVVGVSAYPARRRAQDISRRIRELAQDSKFDPKTLHIKEVGTNHQILTAENGKSILWVLEADAKSEGVFRMELAETIRQSVAEAIKEYRDDRKPAVLKRKAIYALGSTGALIVLLWGMFWLFRRLNGFLERRGKRRMQELEARSEKIFQVEQLWKLLQATLGMLRIMAVLFLVYLFTNFVLGLFPQTRYTAHRMFQFMVAPLGGMFEAIINFIPNLVFLAVLFFITRYGLRVARGVFAAIDRKRLQFKGFEADWAWPTYRIVRVLIILFAVVIAYPYIPGSKSDAFKGMSILLGVLFSLGSSSTVSNIIAGYTMIYRRAFKIGDRVKIGENVGNVTEMRALVTHLKTIKNEEVVIPNSTILNGEVTNYSTMARAQSLILHTTVGIGYDVPWRQVEAMLLLAAEHTEGFLKNPKPFVLQKSLMDFAVNYEINAYCNDVSQVGRLYTNLHRNIQDVFNENGVQIMSPAYERDPAEPKIVPKERWHTPLSSE